MVGGPEGSTAGMRFNPRESAEELQEDSSVGREDSEERALHDAKKREKQEKRARMMQGLQHMKVSVPQKDPEDEEDSRAKLRRRKAPKDDNHRNCASARPSAPWEEEASFQNRHR